MLLEDTIAIENETLLHDALSRLKKPPSYVRIRDRDPKSGKYSYELPDGTILVNGEKIYNTEYQSGDLIPIDDLNRPTVPLDAKSGTLDLDSPWNNSKGKGYINGQIFTIPEGELPIRKNIKYLYTIDDIPNNLKKYYIGGFQKKSILAYQHPLDTLSPVFNLSVTQGVIESDKSFLNKSLNNYGSNSYRLDLHLYTTDEDGVFIVSVVNGKEVFNKNFYQLINVIFDNTANPPTFISGFAGNGFLPQYDYGTIDDSFWSRNSVVWLKLPEVLQWKKYIDLPAKNVTLPKVPGTEGSGLGRNWYNVGRLNKIGDVGIGTAIKDGGETIVNYWFWRNGQLTEKLLPTFYANDNYIDIQKNGFTTISKLDSIGETVTFFEGNETDTDIIMFVNFHDSEFELKQTKKVRVYKPSELGTNFQLIEFAYVTE